MSDQPIPPPISLEQQLHNTVRDCLVAGIAKSLESGYGNPLVKLAEAAVTSRQGEIQALFIGAIDKALSADFLPVLQQACAHKLAKVLVSKMEGEIEKKANDLRSNPETRAKITIAISKCIESL